jgi:hypothetical protein
MLGLLDKSGGMGGPQQTQPANNMAQLFQNIGYQGGYSQQPVAPISAPSAPGQLMPTPEQAAAATQARMQARTPVAAPVSAPVAPWWGRDTSTPYGRERGGGSSR